MANMRFLSVVGNSLGCSASGERLVSAARDGDLLEAKALLEYNPRLARYSTFGVRNSPLHYSAAQGHHEIVSLLIESGVDINLRNYRGQTALMQACQYGRWEVVQILILLKANIHRADCLNGGTALHFASLNDHPQCIRLLLADYTTSIPNICSATEERSKSNESGPFSDRSTLSGIVNRCADGGVTALHMAAMNGHADTVHLLLDLGASVSSKTHDDGTNIDLVGVGSTPLHYAAFGGNARCCQLLIAKGASLTTENEKGWTPLMVARSWNRNWLEEILSPSSGNTHNIGPSPYICLPLRSIIMVARECGWRSDDSTYTCSDPCAVCLERKCSVAAEGCSHEFCTQCVLCLCSTSITTHVANGPPGSIPCPLCRNGIVSFTKLPGAKPVVKEISRTRSLSCCRSWYTEPPEQMRLCTSNSGYTCLGCHGSPQVNSRHSLCHESTNADAESISGSVGSGKRLVRCLRSGHRRSSSQDDGRKWLCSFSHSIED